MQIGEAARSVGLETSAIRYYEAHGIVPQPQRTAAGYRDYQEDDVELLQFVRRLRSLELPLDDVREIVSLRTDGHAPCTQVRNALTREATTIDQRIRDLHHLRDELTRLQAAADQIRDDWPTSCVCHLLEPATSS
ncbi:MAG: MerR family transcriptional regulator [Armatimonadetes bacterium]|nr:MAG: MerR family transcriptional regulator [Armatimonadota bacterium]